MAKKKRIVPETMQVAVVITGNNHGAARAVTSMSAGRTIRKCMEDLTAAGRSVEESQAFVHKQPLTRSFVAFSEADLPKGLTPNQVPQEATPAIRRAMHSALEGRSQTAIFPRALAAPARNEF